MLFAILCEDKPNRLSVRQATRPAHLDHLESLGQNLKGAGPTLDADGNPNGSLILIEAESQAQAEIFSAADPYAKAGLFQTVSIRPWNWALANPYD